MIGNTIEDFERISEKIDEAREFISNVIFNPLSKPLAPLGDSFQIADQKTFNEVGPVVECISRISDVGAALHMLYINYDISQKLLDHYDSTGDERELLKTLREESHELERLYHQRAGMFRRAA